MPLIRYSAMFALEGAAPQNATVTNVWFQYGTEPSPAILAGGGLLLVGLGRTVRKRLRRDP